MSTFHLFAYGTLQSGAAAASLLAGCTSLGSATVNGMLYDIDGRFPAVVLYGEADVHGELWRCPASLLLQLDEYEGTRDGLFRRVGLEARSADGASVPCWVYAAGPALSRKLVPEKRIHGGRWTPPAGVVRR